MGLATIDEMHEIIATIEGNRTVGGAMATIETAGVVHALEKGRQVDRIAIVPAKETGTGTAVMGTGRAVAIGVRTIDVVPVGGIWIVPKMRI